jgi:porin
MEKKYLLTLALLSLGLAQADQGFSGTRTQRHRDLKENLRGDDQRSFAHRHYLFGDFGGDRARLAERGWTFSASYTTDVQWNVEGGLEKGYGSAGSLGIDMQVDLERLAHIRGLIFHAGFVQRSGVNLSQRKVGNAFAVAQLYGSETYQLGTLYFQQTAGPFLFKLGRLYAGDDFLQSDLYYQYVSNAFCGNPVGIFSNAPFSAYPNATWGAFFQWTTSDYSKWKFAIYDGNEQRKDNKFHGTYFRFKSDSGALGITELEYEVGKRTESKLYPGTYKVGLYGVSQKVANFTGGEGYNYGTYFQFDQTLYLPDPNMRERGLKSFGAFLLAPATRNQFPFYFTTGLQYVGIFKARPKDTVAIGLARGGYSAAQRRVEPGRHYEAVLEVNYKLHLSPFWYITPDYQYIIHPSGTTHIPNAHVVGLQTGVTF